MTEASTTPHNVVTLPAPAERKPETVPEFHARMQETCTCIASAAEQFHLGLVQLAQQFGDGAPAEELLEACQEMVCSLAELGVAAGHVLAQTTAELDD